VQYSNASNFLKAVLLSNSMALKKAPAYIQGTLLRNQSALVRLHSHAERERSILLEQRKRVSDHRARQISGFGRSWSVAGLTITASAMVGLETATLGACDSRSSFI
jgi:hypothetical protein